MNTRIKGILTVATVAVLYTLLTYLSAVIGLSYGAVQFRLSEGLMILAAHNKYAVLGLTFGCVLGNLTSPLGPIDILVGSLATFISAFLIYFICKNIKNRALRISVTVTVSSVINALLIAAEISLLFFEGFSITALTVFAGEVAVGALLCYPLEKTIGNIPLLKNFFMKRSWNS